MQFFENAVPKLFQKDFTATPIYKPHKIFCTSEFSLSLNCFIFIFSYTGKTRWYIHLKNEQQIL